MWPRALFAAGLLYGACVGMLTLLVELRGRTPWPLPVIAALALALVVIVLLVAALAWVNVRGWRARRARKRMDQARAAAAAATPDMCEHCATRPAMVECKIHGGKWCGSCSMGVSCFHSCTLNPLRDISAAMRVQA